MPDIWFWQRILTPHMMSLAAELSGLGVNVIYVAQERMSAERKEQGWLEPEAGGVMIEIAGKLQAVHQLVAGAPEDSIHICEGIRANGLVGVAQKCLAARGLAQWVIIETVRDVGWRGILKRFEYARLFRKGRSAVTGVLAAGYRTPQWLIQRGVPEEKIFPFAYFLEKSEPVKAIVEPIGPFRFVFVGQFIPRKRLNCLIAALGTFTDQDFELVVIGSGPLEEVLRTQAAKILGEKVNWIGKLPSKEVRAYIAASDCLVLPSLFDGWGAVVSEALMCGTPVICSDTCGSAGVVDKSGVGGVVRSGDAGELKTSLEAALHAGPVSKKQRSRTVSWGESLGAEAGARYLLKILAAQPSDNEKIQPPWVDEQDSIGVND
jgi:glycosyltransferase involved in cell wall biosynthesis